MKNLHLSADLRISGYASVFDRRDLSGDIVRRGAFSASLLKLQMPALPMLLGHDTDAPIGVWDRLIEDRSGLFVSGRIFAGDPRADRTAKMVAEGAMSGLSIGYRALRVRKADASQSAGRELLELDLWEVSVVAFPMLRDARITQIGDPNISQSSPLTQGDLREQI